MKKLSFLAATALLVSACGPKDSPGTETPAVAAHSAMVVTANPIATEAGKQILAQGGSAVDAAVAIASTLSLVEPQSSGLGGGAFLVHYDAATKAVTAYDGREVAPAGATSDMFLQAITTKDRRQGYFQAKNSGLSVGVPGLVAMLNMAHGDHGKLAWGALFDGAIETAEQGFPISPRLHYMYSDLSWIYPSKPEQGVTDAFDYFHDDAGKPYPVGHILKNPEYAQTLRLIAADYRNFYEGELAQTIAGKVQAAPRAGSMTTADLAAYQPKKFDALCAPYRVNQVCGPPPASSWLAVAMTLGILDQGPAFSEAGVDDMTNWALFIDAQRLAYADRDHYVADPAFVDVPVEGMLNQQYLQQRAALLQRGKAIEVSVKGDPWQFDQQVASRYGKDLTNDLPSTTHFVVRDQQGNVVSMTASVESIFGSSRMAGGMFLNNQLTDFSFRPVDDEGKPVANAIAPGKRPRSSMSPTIVLDGNGDFLMATGSPGGNSIIAYTAKSLVGVLDWGLTPQEAVALPNVVARGDQVKVELSEAPEGMIDALREMGFTIKESSGENSGLSVIYRNAEGKLVGGVDPRREGTIAGL